MPYAGWRGAGATVLCFAAVATACTSGAPSGAPASDAGARQKCVTTATYVALYANDPVHGDFSSDTLPAGACDPSDPPCKPILRPPDCGCPRYPGPASFYDCRC